MYSIQSLLSALHVFCMVYRKPALLYVLIYFAATDMFGPSHSSEGSNAKRLLKDVPLQS
jgi:hypothetical protein